MQLIKLLKMENIFIEDSIANKNDVLELLAEKYVKGNEKIKRKILKAFLKREKINTTGIGDGVAIPHAICKDIKDLNVILIVNKKGIDFNAIDNKNVHIIIGIFANIKDQKLYLSLLANTARVFSKKGLIKKILNAHSKEEIYNEIKRASEL